MDLHPPGYSETFLMSLVMERQLKTVKDIDPKGDKTHPVHI
jgi:hypothetical protein